MLFPQKGAEGALPACSLSSLQLVPAGPAQALCGAGSRSELDQGLQHPLNFVPAVSESGGIWTFTPRFLACRSERNVYTHVHLSAQCSASSDICHILTMSHKEPRDNGYSLALSVTE